MAALADDQTVSATGATTFDPCAINQCVVDPTSSSLYEKQRLVVDDDAADSIRYRKERYGHVVFNVHGSFSSGAPRELLLLLVEEVKNMGGNFTAAHIANASDWQGVWVGKLRQAERVIVVFDKAYKGRFTVNCKWEADQIYRYSQATRERCPICVFFVDEATLKNPEKLRPWLANISHDDKYGEGFEKYSDSHMDRAALEEWHAWCEDPSNLHVWRDTCASQAGEEVR